MHPSLRPWHTLARHLLVYRHHNQSDRRHQPIPRSRAAATEILQASHSYVYATRYGFFSSPWSRGEAHGYSLNLSSVIPCKFPPHCRSQSSVLAEYLSPSASFRDPTAAPLPNLIGTLLDKNARSKQAAAEPGPSKAPTNATTISGVDEAAISKEDGRKKPTKMRVTKHKSARNLYAHRFMKENPSTTAPEFDKAWKSLSDDVLKVRLLSSPERVAVGCLETREYALLCSAESLDEIAEAWAKMSEENRKEYYKPEVVQKDCKGKGKATQS
ncbi:hypothetical protein OH77DRAFT_1390068 [Trametes cingulata]|nr:hypothetical protein OH77DRAFT_1390068 [Trametes cingulata]